MRGFIERLVGPLEGGAAALLAEAEDAAAKGDAAGAAAIYAEILQRPGRSQGGRGPRAASSRGGALDQAKALLETARAAARQGPGSCGRGRLGGAGPGRTGLERRRTRAARTGVAANPDDHQSRFDLAVALSAKGERDAAADHLLEIIRRDRKWNDEARAQATVAALRSLGPDGPGLGRRAPEALGDLVLTRARREAEKRRER